MASKVVTLVSKDGKAFPVEEQLARTSQTISTLLNDLGLHEDGGDGENRIPLPNVNGDILEKVIQWAEHYITEDSTRSAASGDKNTEGGRVSRAVRGVPIQIPEWDKEFLAVDRETLFALTLAANYLDIKELLDLTTQTIADTMIRGKKPAEIRAALGIRAEAPYREELEEE